MSTRIPTAFQLHTAVYTKTKFSGVWISSCRLKKASWMVEVRCNLIKKERRAYIWKVTLLRSLTFGYVMSISRKTQLIKLYINNVLLVPMNLDKTAAILGQIS